MSEHTKKGGLWDGVLAAQEIRKVGLEAIRPIVAMKRSLNQFIQPTVHLLQCLSQHLSPPPDVVQKEREIAKLKAEIFGPSKAAQAPAAPGGGSLERPKQAENTPLKQEKAAPAASNPAAQETDSPKQKTAKGPAKAETDKARERFLNAIAKNLSGKRVKDVDQAAHLIAGNLRLNEKLQKIVELFPLTANFSSRVWAEIFGVTHAAIQDTDWWKKNRRGEKDRRIAEREDRLRERGKTTTQRELQGGNPD